MVYQTPFTPSPKVASRDQTALQLLKVFEEKVKGERQSLALPDVFSWFDAVFDLPRAWFHTEIIDTIVNSPYRFILVLAPPGHGKTTAAMAAVAYMLGLGLARNCVIASYEGGYASKIMAQICDVLRSPISERLIGQIIPPAPEYDPRIKRWTSEERYFLNSSYLNKDPTLKAIGEKSGGVGTRCSLVLADDLVTIPNSSSPVLRQNLWSWFTGGPLKRLEPNGKVIVVGARLFVDDLYGQLKEMSIENGGDWKVLEYTATPDKPLWPVRFGPEELTAAYRNDPVLFPAQYLQKPRMFARGILKKEWLQYYLPESTNLENLPMFAGVDPSKSESKGSDRFVMAIGAWDGNAVYLKEFVSGEYSISEQLEIVKGMAQKYKLSLVNVEEDYALADLLRHDSEAMFRVNYSPSLLAKELRLKSLGSLALKGKLLIPGRIGTEGAIVPRDDFEAFVKEWEEFPGGEKDDHLDAVDKLVEAASLGLEAAATVIKGDRAGSEANKGHRERRSQLLFHDEVMI